MWWRAIRLAISNAGGAPGSANLRLLHSATHSSQHWSNRASGRERAAACLAQPFHTHTQTHSRARAHTHTHTLSLSHTQTEAFREKLALAAAKADLQTAGRDEFPDGDTSLCTVVRFLSALSHGRILKTNCIQLKSLGIVIYGDCVRQQDGSEHYPVIESAGLGLWPSLFEEGRMSSRVACALKIAVRDPTQFALPGVCTVISSAATRAVQVRTQT